MLSKTEKAKIQELTAKTFDLIVENMDMTHEDAEKSFKESDTYNFLLLAKRNLENAHPIVLYRMFNSELKTEPIDEEQQSFIDFMADKTIELIVQNTNWGREKATKVFKSTKVYWMLVHSGHNLDESSPEELFDMFRNEFSLGSSLPSSMLKLTY